MSHKRHKIKEHEVQALKYFKAISHMLESLRHVGCERDRAGNRRLHMDQYVSLLLLYMFNPICTSLRSLQQTTELKKVQRKLGVPRASLGSLSEAATVFDSEAMIEIIEQLGAQLKPLTGRGKLNDLPGILTAVDGTLLKGLPKIAWALWIDDKHKAVKNHVHFEILKGVPVKATLTEGNGNEKDVLAETLAIATDLMDVEADVIALIFQYRWTKPQAFMAALIFFEFSARTFFACGVVGLAP